MTTVFKYLCPEAIRGLLQNFHYPLLHIYICIFMRLESALISLLALSLLRA